MKNLIIAISLIFIGCSENPKEPREVQCDLSDKAVKVESSEILTDTLNSSFPVQIGNDKGLVNIIGIRKFVDQKVTTGNFVITLDDILNFSISKQIDKSVLIDSNKSVLLIDSVNSDYLSSAVLKNVEFDFVRANTLYFNAILENPKEGKEIIGRFNMFYRTKKKGIVYGWNTDEINEVSDGTE